MLRHACRGNHPTLLRWSKLKITETGARSLTLQPQKRKNYRHFIVVLTWQALKFGLCLLAKGTHVIKPIPENLMKKQLNRLHKDPQTQCSGWKQAATSIQVSRRAEKPLCIKPQRSTDKALGLVFIVKWSGQLKVWNVIMSVKMMLIKAAVFFFFLSENQNKHL